MTSKKKPTSVKLADNSLILEAMTMSSEELLESGYVKLSGSILSQFSPVIGLIESLGIQQWVGKANAKNVEEILKGTYRCYVNGSVLTQDVLSKAKDFPQFYRGLVHGSKGVSSHAAWERLDPKEIANTIGKAPAPNVVAIIFQVLSIATSLYYMHEMNSNFENICIEIKSLKEQFMIQDASEIIAGHKSITNMVKHFDSIMQSDKRCQNESIKLGQIEFDALKQIERSRLKLQKNYPLNPKKDNLEKADSNITGIINTLAQLKMSIYVYGMAKGLRVCFDDVDTQEEVFDFIDEIKEQIDSYKETVKKSSESLNDYVSTSKALNKLSGKQVGTLLAIGAFAGPLAPVFVAGIDASVANDMKNKLEAHKSKAEEQIKKKITLDDIDSLSTSISFLEDYAVSLDSKLEIVSNNGEYYILPNLRDKE